MASKGGLWGWVAAGAIILAYLAFLGYPTFSSLSNLLPQQSSVSIINQTFLGTYSVTGNGTTLSKMTFYNSNGIAYSATINSSTTYSVTLPNKNATYVINATWKSNNFTWQGGKTHSTLPFIFNTSKRTSQKLIFLTPDSIILIKGTYSGPQGSFVNYINYTAQGKLTRRANVSFGAYEVYLPNMATYQVSMVYQFVQDKITGNMETCQAGYLTLNESEGVSNVSDYRNCS